MTTQPIRTEPHASVNASRSIACFQCSHQNQPGSKFCSACGRSFERRITSPRPVFTGAGWTAYQALDARKENIFRLSRRALYLACASLLLIWGGTYVLASASARDDLAMVPVAIAFVTFFLAIVLRPGWLSRSEYYSLPESRGADGEHRCVKCGHGRFYFKGEYRTDNRYARCTKCELELFVE